MIWETHAHGAIERAAASIEKDEVPHFQTVFATGSK